MASGGQKALSGAAQGAAAGAVFGPWGALIGGAAGGIMGLAQGDDPEAPNYVPGAPPRIPGGTSGQYGGMYYDPTTGSTQSLSYGFDPSQMGSQIDNQSLLNQLMGRGNEGMTNNLDFQLQSLQQQLQRLQGQQGASSGIGSQKGLADVLGPNVAKMITNPDGSLIDFSDRNALIQNPALVAAFHDATKDTHGTFGKSGDGFMNWFKAWRDNAGIDSKIQGWKQSQDVNVGNTDQRNQAIQALQNQIQYITKAKEQAEAAPTDNPLMNFLNQRNMDPNGGDYSGKYIDPWTQKMSDEADLYRDASHQNYNTTLNPDGSIKSQSELGVPDARALTAKMEANWKANGAFGGERMAPLGPYGGSGAGAFINSLNRTAEASAASNRALAAEQAARRGTLGGSSEVGDLAILQGLQASRDANAANQYMMGRADDQQDFANRFAINQHNSDVARTGAQFSANGLNQILQQGFGNEMTAAQFYEALKQQGFTNNQAEQQRNYGNMMGTQGQSSALGQLTLNNQRYDQGLDQQNFQDRLGLMGFLSGQTQQGFQNDLSRIGVTNQQAGIGNQVGQFNANNANQWEAANAAGNNAQRMGGWQQGINDQAATQQAMGQGMLGVGAGLASYYANKKPSTPTTTKGATPGGVSPNLMSGANPSNPAIPGGTNQNLQFSGLPTWMDYSKPRVG